MTLVHLLSMKKESVPVYLPFEMLRFLSHHFNQPENSLSREDFDSQVSQYFTQGEDDYEQEVVLDMITLSLKNSKYTSIEKDQDKKKVNVLLLELAQILDHLVSNLSTNKLLHVFLCTITLILNEPEFCDENKQLIKRIMEKLALEEIVSEESLIAKSFSSYKILLHEFLYQDYETQNNLLYQERR